MKLIVPVIVLVFIAVFSNSEFLPRTFKEGLFFIATPMFKAERFLGDGIYSVSAAWREKEGLFKENRGLEEQIEEYKTKLLLVNSLIEENRLLKERLGRGEDPRNSMLAVVLSKPNRTPYDTLLIDVGREDGVESGDAVRAYDDVIIGVVADLTERSSIVKLFSSPGEEIHVTLGSENIATVARGAGGGNFEAELPRGVDVLPGDVVSFPSISEEIAGVVERIEAYPADAYQTILFKSPVNLFTLKYVEVLLGTKSR